MTFWPHEIPSPCASAPPQRSSAIGAFGKMVTSRLGDGDFQISEFFFLLPGYPSGYEGSFHEQETDLHCTAPKGPKGPLKDLKDRNRNLLLRSERTQGFAAGPVSGRAKCLPMLGAFKT